MYLKTSEKWMVGFLIAIIFLSVAMLMMQHMGIPLPAAPLGELLVHRFP